MSSLSDVPGPRWLDWVSFAYQSYGTDPSEVLLNLREKYGRFVRIYHPQLGGYALLVSDPNIIQKMLIDDQTKFGPPDIQPTRDFNKVMGDGLVASQGDWWRQQHRRLMPYFQKDQVMSYGEIFLDEIRSMIERWKRENKQKINLLQEMKRVTLKIICRALFSVDVSGQVFEIRDAMTTLRRGFKERGGSIFTLPLWIPTQFHRSLWDAMETLNNFAYGIVQNRRNYDDQPDDMLGTLIEAEDDRTGQPLTDKQIRDEIVNFLIAGHETTAAAITWAWYLLNKNPEFHSKLHSESAEIAESDLSFSPELTNTIGESIRVFKESLRLYPTVPMFSRAPTEDQTVNGHPLPAGTTCVISPYVIQRDPQYWTNPKQFDPDRFMEKRDEPTHRMAYLPFSYGAHQCTGMNLAKLEGPLILSLVSKEWNLTLSAEVDTPVKPDTAVNLEPDRDLIFELRDWN